MLNKQRVEALTDAILAIIMTIMILEVKIPSEPSIHALGKVFIPMVAFTVSFFSLINLWLGHHDIFKRAQNITYGVFWVNMVLLFWVAAIPVATAWVAEYPWAAVPQALYCILGIGWGFLLAVLGWLVDVSEKPLPFPWRQIWRSSYWWLFSLILSFFIPYVALTLGIIRVVWVSIVISMPHKTN
ncbi:TMEM175 family protein [Furfurilactobacillus siliginis]|uniref:DUF1211 domain-containing membrane protein n=1 Tax=Furfurilactobacillus siliginis TaxID=348151 RepID=A0A0R2L104_9LACO|nr:TMEM175 family protein [Furfurilactobacillus siliginis]KRN95481.1 hypothetical protein IV55_GL001942 [Furfurilactobacillus siliginis]GEK28255.1 DUF1211 domain-containing membrane protein [Furfurilactobacillus siliginis]